MQAIFGRQGGQLGSKIPGGGSWFGVFVPAGKHEDAFLNRGIVSSMADPGVRARLLTLGFEPVGGTPTEFRKQAEIELEKWAKVIRAANIKG